MIQKRILVPARLRRPPATGWSWVDRRFLSEYAERLSGNAVSLYFVLCAAADKHGLSFYGDDTLSARLRITPAAVDQAREELLARDLIAHQPPLTQVLALPSNGVRRQPEPGQGPMRLGELFRRAAVAAASGAERSSS
jgi:hypothetical protein